MNEFTVVVTAVPLQSAAELNAFLPDCTGWEVDGRFALSPHADWIGVPNAQGRVVGCGRLDEREALGVALGLSSEQALAEPALIAAAYARWGSGCSARLVGDFAFGLWDEKRKALLVVRDQCGSVPVYYCQIDGHLLVSSDIRVLLRAPALRRQASTRAVVDYIAELPPNEFETAFVGVRRLPPGYCLLWQDGQTRVQRHCYPSGAQIRLGSEEDHAEAFLEVLRKAVACRVAPGPSGVMLSGGLDSSLIASLVAEASPSTLLAFSGGFAAGAPWDEYSYQDSVVNQLGAEHHVVAMECSEEGLDIHQALDLYAEPAPVGGHWMAWPLMAEASRRGVTSMFTGLDGDRVVSHGLGRLQELAGGGQLAELWREARASTGLRGGTRVALTKLVLSQLPRQIVRARDRSRAVRKFDRSPAARLFHPSVLSRIGARERYSRQWERPWTAREDHLAGLERWDRAADMEVMAPLASRFGIATCHPFFDRRVIEFCLALPSDQKLRRGRSRAILRDAAAGLIPERVRDRADKAYFDRPFENWARRSLARQAEKNISFIELGPILDTRALTAALRLRSESVPVDLLWRCVVVSAWLRHHRLSLA